MSRSLSVKPDDLRAIATTVVSAREAEAAAKAAQEAHVERLRKQSEIERRYEEFLQRVESTLTSAARQGLFSVGVFTPAEDDGVTLSGFTAKTIDPATDLRGAAQRVWDWCVANDLKPTLDLTSSDITDYDSDGGMHMYAYRYEIVAHW